MVLPIEKLEANVTLTFNLPSNFFAGKKLMDGFVTSEEGNSQTSFKRMHNTYTKGCESELSK